MPQRLSQIRHGVHNLVIVGMQSLVGYFFQERSPTLERDNLFSHHGFSESCALTPVRPSADGSPCEPLTGGRMPHPGPSPGAGAQSRCPQKALHHRTVTQEGIHAVWLRCILDLGAISNENNYRYVWIENPCFVNGFVLLIGDHFIIQ